MLVRLHKWLVVISLVILIGGHWALLQSAAWAGMLLNYSNRSTISEAVTKTFSGDHPCQLCKIVREGQKAEKRHEMVKLETKFDFSVVAGTAWLFPPRPCRQFADVNTFSSGRIEPPLRPPPRSA